MRIYYAHSKQIYGSQTEQKELECIENGFPNCEIFNPNGKIPDKSDFEPKAREIIETVGKVVFTTYQGFIGKGVFYEIGLAHDLGKQVLMLREDGTITTNFALGEVNEDDWTYYCDVRTE